jgi:glycosyltransferase involved in cell wall biosynthesis
VRRLGLAERVRLLGKRRDVEAVLAASDVYVLSSIGSEGSSRATLEALATGLPVLCADVGMLPDIVRENETGYLFPPGDERALRDLLARVVDDRHLRARLGRAARAWAVDNRSEEAMLESVLRVYRRVLAGAAR